MALKTGVQMGANDERVLTVFSELAKQLAGELQSQFEHECLDAAASQASPIEQLMAASFLYLLRSPLWYGGEGATNIFRYGVSHPDAPLDEIPTRHGVWIIPQLKIKKFRADFGIRFAHWDGGFVWGAVECDGHDFHERTKEQAERDRSRDRVFQDEGLLILRFTGAEIWRAPHMCAANALSILERRAISDTARRWGKD